MKVHAFCYRVSYTPGRSFRKSLPDRAESSLGPLDQVDHLLMGGHICECGHP